jgi:hypothetical protein
MFWMRLIMVTGFSLTAFSLFLYEGIEIMHAFTEYFSKNK